MATRELTLEERLARFAGRWKDYRNTELAGAQTFLRELKECYGVWDHAPGTVFEQHPVKPIEEKNGELFEDAPRRSKASRPAVTAERMDMYIPKVVVWEMKGPEEKDLSRHHTQLLGYWARMRPRYMVLCNFLEFWIYDTDLEGGQIEPALRFTLEQLPEHAQALAFLSGEEAFFAQRSALVTREAAQYVGDVLRTLIRQSADPVASRPRFTKFTLECVFAMFAEDSEILPTKPFTAALKQSQASGDLAPVYNLFDDLGRASDADRALDIPYVNGPLFDREHPKFPVAKELLSNLFIAAEKFDWRAVRPEVFGSIFERALLSEERGAAGAHFTSEADIMKVVGPTIVRPWQERIAAARTYKDCEALIERMKHYHILDPACGSGNFLYVAYREMKRLEVALREKHQMLWRAKEKKKFNDNLPPPPGPYFSIHQLHGIDKLSEAVQLSRVVLWIGEHLANLELNLGESTLPLTSLEQNIIEADALFTDWFRPPDDGVSELAIVGNPPFMGRHKLRQALGDEYVDKLHTCFPANRDADLVTYWYPLAVKTLRHGERAGFVSTNSIGQNESREASIDLIVDAGGTLIDCWKSYPWPGEANVHVSIVCWVDSDYHGAAYLEGRLVNSISSTLSDRPELRSAGRLTRNAGLSNQGVLPAAVEFTLDSASASALVEQDPKSAAVIKPYLVGRDLNSSPTQSPSRQIVDFNGLTLAEAQGCFAAFRHVQLHVYPVRMASRLTELEKSKWWQFKRPAQVMRDSIVNLDRFLVTSRAASILIFSFCQHPTLPDSKVMVVALDDSFHFGVLQSAVHETWAWARGSTLKGDLAYTNTTIFETFPFPPLSDGGYDPRVVPGTPEAAEVSRVAEELYVKRQAACKSLNLGLTKLYNLIKGKQDSKGRDPFDSLTPEHKDTVSELRMLHDALNDAVCACYGWPKDTWRNENEVLTRLLELNRELAHQ